MKKKITFKCPLEGDKFCRDKNENCYSCLGITPSDMGYSEYR